MKENPTVRIMENNAGDVQNQFNERAKYFNNSANWVTDTDLLKNIAQMVDKPAGTKGLDLCCGTGRVSLALKAYSNLDMSGIDLTPGMIRQSSKIMSVTQGNVENMPFANNSVDFVVIRQALFLTDSNKTLNEAHRILRPGGQFIVCNMVPINEDDSEYLKQVHLLKQPQLKQFYTSDNLKEELERHNFVVQKSKSLIVRESIERWMFPENTPELPREITEEVIDKIRFSPSEYFKTRNIKLENGQTMENWGWQIYSVTPDKSNQRVNL